MKNVVASILDRLKKVSRNEGRAYNLVLDDYATARFIARLSVSSYKDGFILKGAQLFKLWAESPHRPTRDADFLSFGASLPEELETIFQEICRIETEPPDGIVWKIDGVAQIREDNLYGGVRIKLTATLGKVRIPAQVDVGFGDSITPEARMADWPMPLDFPTVPLRVYCPETSIAEKLHAAVILENSNSRMKDFFDICWLSNHLEFERDTLRSAIEATFERRETPMPTQPPLALTAEFGDYASKIVQWNAFLRKGRLEAPNFSEIIARNAEFLIPVVLTQKDMQNTSWTPEAGWSNGI